MSDKNSLTNIFNSFIKKVQANGRIKHYSVRDNCGEACLDFLSYATDELKSDHHFIRVQGNFKTDIVVHAKKDFTKEMKKEFLELGYDWNSKEHRRKYIEESKYNEEYHLCPHYWIEDLSGNIYDPSGEGQFVSAGLASDLDASRYKATCKDC